MRKRPWLFLAPGLIILSISAFVPLMAGVNYSQLFLFAGGSSTFAGLDNFMQVLTDPDFQGSLGRQLIFSFLILCIQIPFGIFLATKMPKEGVWVAILFVLLGIISPKGLLWGGYAQ